MIFDFMKKKPAQTEKKSKSPYYEYGSVNVDKSDNFKAYIPYFLYKPPFGYPRTDTDVIRCRKLAQTPYVFSVIKAIRDRVNSVDYDIVYANPKDQNEKNDKERERIRKFFKNPNGNFESIYDLQSALVRDLLELDAGVVVKVFNRVREFRQIFVRDAGTFLINPNIYGYIGNRDDFVDIPTSYTFVDDESKHNMKVYETLFADKAAYFQYGWTPGSLPVPFGKREVAYVMLNKRSDSIYGRSPVQILTEIVYALIYGGRHNLDYYINNNIPQGIISLLNANESQIKSFRARLQEHLQVKDVDFDNWRRQPYKIPVINTESKFTNWQISSKEMEILESQKWYLKLVYKVFGINPDELGDTEDSNRTIANEQSRIIKKRALKPILHALEYMWNNEIMTELDPDGVFRFKYSDYDVEEDYRKNELNVLRMNYMTINEVRQLNGLQPIQDGEAIRGLMAKSDKTFPDDTAHPNPDGPKSDLQSIADKQGALKTDREFDKSNPRSGMMRQVEVKPVKKAKYDKLENLDEQNGVDSLEALVSKEPPEVVDKVYKSLEKTLEELANNW